MSVRNYLLTPLLFLPLLVLVLSCGEEKTMKYKILDKSDVFSYYHKNLMFYDSIFRLFGESSITFLEKENDRVYKVDSSTFFQKNNDSISSKKILDFLNREGIYYIRKISNYDYNEYKELKPSIEVAIKTKGENVIYIKRHGQRISIEEMSHYEKWLFSHNLGGKLDDNTIWYIK